MPNKPSQHTDDLRKRGVLAQRAESDAAYRRTRSDDETQAAVDRLRNCAQWRDVRRMVLAREPLCRDCLMRGLTTAATQVDHVLGLVEHPELAYDLDNLAPICDACHARKTGAERARRARRVSP